MSRIPVYKCLRCRRKVDDFATVLCSDCTESTDAQAERLIEKVGSLQDEIKNLTTHPDTAYFLNCPECGDRRCDGTHRGLGAGVPLPGSPRDRTARCRHGDSLIDGNGDIADPPCGCTADFGRALKFIISEASGVNQRNLTDACLRLNRIGEIAQTALRARRVKP